MEREIYKVTYAVKRLSGRSGEFSHENDYSLERFLSNTNEVDDIFTDLYEAHRGRHVVGIEILAIENLNVKEPELVPMLR